MQAIGDTLPFILAFAAVVLLVFAVGSLVPAANPLRRRLTNEPAERRDRRSLLRTDDATMPRFLLRMFVRPADQDRDGDMSPLRLKLVRAGYYSLKAPAIFHAARTGLACALPIAVGSVMPLLLPRVSFGSIIMAGLAFGLLGYMLPTLVVSARGSSRYRILRESFPDSLDMLLMCVEAGVGLDEAMKRVGEELKSGHPLLAWHFDLLSAELRAGKSRDRAFAAFSDRIGLDEVRAFVALTTQTEALGTSMADTLRSMSDDMRQRRLLRAEEMAQKVSTKLSVVLMTLVLPVLLIVITAPAIIGAVRSFQHLRH